ncbi:hypothetical protein [Bosea sp. (in: a-proteobacteria)]|jgi:4-amino-4-deoxy-L-arabinose transferase-like glycosyltransferase|uniref:hypothetical protein n=1 Tax=Bosea sp. (in: a-proteobacteria) TaxID=1871050 RepID=UPI0035626B1E
MTTRHHRAGSSWRGLALARLVLALGVMLLAVLPHATLAASAWHTPVTNPAVAASPAHHTHGEAAPCHDQSAPSGEAKASGPSCCILGCGLLGQAPALPVHALATVWRTLTPSPVASRAALSPEPAERPPRPAAA